MKQEPKTKKLFYAWMFNDGSQRSEEVAEPDPWIKDFINRFQAKYGKMPTRNNSWGYACVRIFEQAIADTGTVDKKKIADYLHSGAKFKSPFGYFRFEWCGQSRNKCGIGRYEGGKKFFLTDKNWADDVIGDLCPQKK